jgi:hypothetical protein
LFIDKARTSRAYAVWKSGRKEDLIDYDVKLFFQFGTTTPFADRRVKVALANEAIAKACSLGIEGSDDLLALAKFMQDKYAKLLQGEDR